MQSRSGYKNAKKGQKKTPTEPFYGFCWVPIGDPHKVRTEHPIRTAIRAAVQPK